MEENKMRHTTVSFLLRVTVTVILLTGIVAVTKGQPAAVPITITSVAAEPVKDSNNQRIGWVVVARFSASLGGTGSADFAAYTKPSNYSVIDVTTVSPLTVSEAKGITITGVAGVPGVKLLIAGSDAFEKNKSYHLYISNLTFGGAPPATTVQGPITVRGLEAPTAPDSSIDSTDLPKPAWGLGKSDGRDDSDLYGSYEVTSVRGADGATTGSADIKVKVPFRIDMWKRSSTIAPFFDLKVSSNAKADPDSIKFGVEWRIPSYVGNDPDASFPYTQIALASSGLIEAPKNLDNVNAVLEERLIFPCANLLGGGSKTKLYIDPFLGFEVGKNLKSPLPEAEGNAIFRGIFGANLRFKQPVSGVFLLKSIGFETGYIGRVHATRELTFEKQSNGTYTLLAYDKGPKHYVNSKLIFKVNDYFGPYVGFEWGRLPPKYNFVDHKWTFGLLFKSKVTTK